MAALSHTHGTCNTLLNCRDLHYFGITPIRIRRAVLHLGRPTKVLVSVSREAETRARDQFHITSDQLPETFSNLAALFTSECRVTAGITPLGRGLIVGENMVRGTTVLSVDRANLLCVADHPEETASPFARETLAEWQLLHGKLPPLLNKYLLDGDPNWFNRMVAWLLWLSAHGSPLWQLYTHSLPKESEMTCLMNYKAHELCELQSPSLEAVARKEREIILGLHERVFSSHTGVLRSLRLADSPTDTVWAACCVNSRAFSDKVGDEAVSLMVPCADMANHSTSPTAAYALAPTSNTFTMVTKKDVVCGSELCISYGCVDKDNDALMKDYGFVLPANKSDRIPFAPVGGPFTNAASASPAIHAPDLFRALGLNGSLTPNGVTLSWPSGSSGTTLGIDGPAGDSVRNMRERQKCVVQSLRPFLHGRQLEGGEVEGKKRTVEWCHDQCVGMLDSCGSSMEMDVELLGGQLSPRHRQAVASRLERKRLLHTAIVTLRHYMEYLKEKHA